MVVQKKKDNLLPNGLRNRGNTCFFNAAMQCILSIGEINTFYMTTEFPKQKEVSNAFKQFIMEYGKPGTSDPSAFISRIGKKMKLFNGRQQDSHEFFIKFIDLLYREFDDNKSRFESKEEFDDTRKSNIIANILFSIDRHMVVCEMCGFSSTRTDLKSTVGVVPCKSIQQGIDGYYEEEILEGANAWQCDGCSMKKRSRKKMEVLVHPEVLVVHILRFSAQGSKITASIEINDVLMFNGRKYSLFGVVCQSGSMNEGHYVAEAKRAGIWNLYDDERVIKACKTYSGSNPYMAFYTLGS
ncbi:ubiquitin carboxyl-terminal hydrolase [Ordospora pajunii]|uniref:ubiquitin carboxyl-terminal hydrolase n=1 Tax=Ordospora pajunii TaxID=3039483 RepID=UPI0029526E0F|nr:ubiquitin carboxyl-terminal hydrolase [Ordospora pajunii]KAH9411913.1 ubiquitin carboxyl-terminal hydrolase [Ordospora pajunii]